ncbi:MAG TPA: inosine monophosphate cyclohydrolase [Clostridiales bacterium]|nr:inosine monophosphate cyclohydrolase [Clostridiales bacterium]
MQDFKKQAVKSFIQLKENPYPGRGIILGMTSDSKFIVQVYWIMGRSENSRNRIFVEEKGFVKTKAFDEKKCTDPSLIIYYPVKHIGSCHIVTNGDQTETIYEKIKGKGFFEDAMRERTFEPDRPNYTPRISGITDLADPNSAYKLCILKTINNQEEYGQKNLYDYQKAIPGYGHCITTYQWDGNPLPSFSTEPLLVPVEDCPDKTAQMYWNALNQEDKVSLLVKFIDGKTGEFKIVIKNKLY